MVAISVYSLARCAHCGHVTEHRRMLVKSESGTVLADKRVCGSCGAEAHPSLIPRARVPGR
jgi:hypothetical protein